MNLIFSSSHKNEVHFSLIAFNKRFVDHSQRVVNPQPTVKILEPPSKGGATGSAKEAAEALLEKKPKQKAYRRSDSTGGNRSRSTTKELALPADDSLMCPPSFLSGLNPNMEVIDGTRLELKVSVKGDPSPQVIWTKDGKELASNDIIEVKYKNGVAVLTVNEIYPEDYGKYTCKATNAKGSVETSTNVKVTPKTSNGMSNGGAAGASQTQPRVYRHLQSSLSKDGEPVTLECTITGDATFDVVWLHNEKEIKPSKDFNYSSKGNTYALEISEVFPEDEGTYTCEAFNDIGECFTTCSLYVEVPGDPQPPIGSPKLKNHPKSLTVNRGDSAAFVAELEAGAAEPLNATWMKDGKELKEQPMKIKLSCKKTLVSLNISDSGSGDAGQYACIVSNSKGDVKAAFSLNVH